MLFRKFGVILLLLTLIPASFLYAQIRSATITGTVKDSTGAVVPEAEVVVTQQETGMATTVKTTAAGSLHSALPGSRDLHGLGHHDRVWALQADGHRARGKPDGSCGCGSGGRGGANKPSRCRRKPSQIQTDSSTVQGCRAIAANQRPPESHRQSAVLCAIAGRGSAAQCHRATRPRLNSFGVGAGWPAAMVHVGRQWRAVRSPTTFSWTASP